MPNGKKRRNNMPTNEDWAYAAGVMDSDGCITLYKRYIKRYKDGVHYGTGVKVSQYTKEVIEWLTNKFGGSYYIRQREDKQFSRIGEDHIWIMVPQRCEWFLKGILPYLVLKRKQAEIVLSFRKTVRRTGDKRKLTDKIQAYREKMYQKMSKLNSSKSKRSGV